MYANVSASWKGRFTVRPFKLKVSIHVVFSQVKVGCYTSAKNIHYRLHYTNFCFKFVLQFFFPFEPLSTMRLTLHASCKHITFCVVCVVYYVTVVLAVAIS